MSKIVINKNFSSKGTVSKNSATGKFVPNVKKTLGNGSVSVSANTKSSKKVIFRTK